MMLFAATLSEPTVTTGTKIDTRTSRPLEVHSPTCLATSQTSALSGSWKNTKFGEITSKISVFSSPKPSTTAANSLAPSTTFTALETRSTTVGFIKNYQNFEISAISNQTPSKTPAPGISGPTNNVTQAYTANTYHYCYSSRNTLSDSWFHSKTTKNANFD